MLYLQGRDVSESRYCSWPLSRLCAGTERQSQQGDQVVRYLPPSSHMGEVELVLSVIMIMIMIMIVMMIMMIS